MGHQPLSQAALGNSSSCEQWGWRKGERGEKSDFPLCTQQGLGLTPQCCPCAHGEQQQDKGSSVEVQAET